MSLVNKMLRDLDARHAGDGERAALPAAVTPLASRREAPRSLPWLWFGAVLAAAGLGAAAWFGGQAGHAPAPLAMSVPAIPAPAVPTPDVPVSAAPATAVPAPAVPASAPAVPARSAAAPVAKTALPSLRMAEQLSAAPVPAAEAPRKPKVAERPAGEAAAPPPPPPVAPVASAKAAPVPTEARIDKQVRLPSPAERAEIEYRRGSLAQRQGNADEAAAGYRAALEDYAEHAAARQTLAALLIEAKRYDEAEDLLRKGTELPAVRLASTLAWARLKVERNQVPAALELLLKNAAAGERSADYQGFAGALLNRAGRTPEAVERYQAATRLAPNEGRWWAGLGIALDAAGKAADAREAYLKARALPGLPADLAQHIEQRLR